MEIVSLEDYNQAQEIMASHAPKRNHPREVASAHLLSGGVFCGICEYKMSPTGGDRSYYNCNHRRRHLSSCDTPNPPADLLDAAVLQHILNKVVTKENTKRVLAIVAKSQTETMMEVEDELRNVSLEIENLKGARRSLLLMVEDKENDVGPGDISERVSEIRDELKGLEANAIEAKAKMSNEKAIISNPEKVAAYVQDLGTYLRGTNLDLTKQILRELAVQVRVLPGETKDTATLIIKYRIPTPPKGWSNEADVEELVLRRNARSLELPVQAAGLRPEDVDLIYGGVPMERREQILERARVVLMTPDVCQAWFMRTIGTPQVSRFLDDLTLLVLDEAHVYESVFGK